MDHVPVHAYGFEIITRGLYIRQSVIRRLRNPVTEDRLKGDGRKLHGK